MQGLLWLSPWEAAGGAEPFPALSLSVSHGKDTFLLPDSTAELQARGGLGVRSGSWLCSSPCGEQEQQGE